MKYRLSVFECYAKTKPDNMGWVQNNIHEEEMTIPELAHILGQGAVFNPGVYNEYPCRIERWMYAQCIALDFDDGYTYDEFVESWDRYNLKPNIVYSTYSHTEQHNRFRAIYFFDSIITNPVLYTSLLNVLHELYPHCDKNALKLAQTYLGTNKQCNVIHEETISITYIPKVLYTEYEIKYSGKKIIHEYNKIFQDTGLINVRVISEENMDEMIEDIKIPNMFSGRNLKFMDMARIQVSFHEMLKKLFLNYIDKMVNQSRDNVICDDETLKTLDIIGSNEIDGLKCTRNEVSVVTCNDYSIRVQENVKLNTIILTYFTNQLNNNNDTNIQSIIHISAFSLASRNFISYTEHTTENIARSVYRNNTLLIPNKKVLTYINSSSNRNKYYNSNYIAKSELCPLYTHFMSTSPNQPRIRKSDRMILVTNSIGVTNKVGDDRIYDGFVNLNKRRNSSFDDEPGDNTYAKWTRDINYVLSQDNPDKIKPWSCNHCSCKDTCKSVSIYRNPDTGDIPSHINLLRITKLYTSDNKVTAYYDPEGNPYPTPLKYKDMAVDDIRIFLSNTLHDIKQKDDTNIHLLLCDTGTGKTHTLLASGDLNGYIICAPTHKLKDEIIARWKEMDDTIGSSLDIWFQPTPPDLSHLPKWDYLLRKTRHMKVDVLSVYERIYKNTDDSSLTNELKDECRKYHKTVMDYRVSKANHKATTVICTHDYFYYNYLSEYGIDLPEHFHTIVFDEDFSSTRIKSAVVKEYDIQKLLLYLDKEYLPSLECRRQYNKAFDIFNYLMKFQKTSYTQERLIIDTISLGRDSLDSEEVLNIIRSYISDTKRLIDIDVLFQSDEVIMYSHYTSKLTLFLGVHGYRFNDFNRKVIIMSATASIPSYRGAHGSRLRVYDLRGTQLKGEIHSFPNLSYSKSFVMDARSIDRMRPMLESYIGKVDGILSYKMMSEQLNYYIEEQGLPIDYKLEGNFGGLLGLNHLNGMDLLTVGTPLPPVEYALMMNRFNGGDAIIDDITPLKAYNIRLNDYIIRLYLTTSHQGMQDILVGHAESEVIQSIGRNRLVSNDCKHYVQSRIIPPGAIVHNVDYYDLV
jgi:hypothetical protein